MSEVTPTHLTDRNSAHPQPPVPGWLRRRLNAPLPKDRPHPRTARDPFHPYLTETGLHVPAADPAAAPIEHPAMDPPDGPTLESLLVHLAPPSDAPTPKRIARRHLEPRHKRRLLRAALALPQPHGEPAAATPRRDWRPMTNAEWAALRPYVERGGPGRPVHDPRTRLDLIFAVATSGVPWREALTLATRGTAMRGDTLSRQFRRWTHAGLWKDLLFALVRTDCPPALRAIEYWVLRAARRAMRVMGAGGLLLARLLGKLTALPLPPALLPNPILSETAEAMQDALYRRGWNLAQEPLHRMLEAVRRAAWVRRPWSRRLAPA